MSRRTRQIGQLAQIGRPLVELPRRTSLSNYYTNFDAATDYARIDADVFDIERTVPWSFSFWMRKTGGNTGQGMGRRGNGGPFRGFAVNIRSGGGIQVEICNDNATNKVDVRSTGFSVITGSWKMVVCTYDGSSTAAGVNIWGGQLVGGASIPTLSNVTDPVPVQDNLSATIRDADARMAIMARFDTVNGVGAFVGEDLADVRFYLNRELSQTEAIELYAAGMMLDNNDFSRGSDCEMWFRMGDNDTGLDYDSNVLADNSDQGNDAQSIALAQSDALLGAVVASWPERAA